MAEKMRLYLVSEARFPKTQQLLTKWMNQVAKRVMPRTQQSVAFANFEKSELQSELQISFSSALHWHNIFVRY